MLSEGISILTAMSLKQINPCNIKIIWFFFSCFSKAIYSFMNFDDNLQHFFQFVSKVIRYFPLITCLYYSYKQWNGTILELFCQKSLNSEGGRGKSIAISNHKSNLYFIIFHQMKKRMRCSIYLFVNKYVIDLDFKSPLNIFRGANLSNVSTNLNIFI